MKIKTPGEYITAAGHLITITAVEKGLAIGHYYQKRTPNKKRSTMWRVNGSHAVQNKSKLDIIAPAPLDLRVSAQPKVVPIADAQFGPSPDTKARRCDGFVAVVRNEAGSPYPYFKSSPFPSVESLDRWAARKGFADRVVEVREVRESRTVWSAS